MIHGLPEVAAAVATRLPDDLHHRGPANDWVRMTRPGATLHSFLEGPVFGPDGALYLADVPYGRIFRVAGLSDWAVAFAYEGEPHGLAFAEDGSLIVADYRQGLLRVDLGSGSARPLCTRFNTEAFRGVSDLAIDAEGDVWFTDPGRSSLTDPTGRLFRLRRDGALDCVLANVPYPNGVAFSDDGAHVFLAATRANAVWRLLRNAPERGTPMCGLYLQLSGGLGPDGLAVSRQGELAVAHAQAGQVWVFDRFGEPLLRIRTPSGRWTTAVRFGGANGRTLHIVEAQAGALLVCDLERVGPGAAAAP
ncbi:gluconolactonase [Tistlia consotensis]|uniref:Gluconolactonase n=1 Tax=Tistlia consotensis USBA 355 TaxID=560819 RepID=A0A1Y6C1M2_9PROT|nr:SMP-30/gluconolactonase/LRE family protein [Tistlia consotensis]SMF38859.1 gluconolactonase [Tistlia consotensis USBA 355]SNR36775.1 gluconolactonase [Tistlia consotensis]